MNKKGFTLIELLVVIAIIGILSSIAIVYLGDARNKANDAKVASNLTSASTQLEIDRANGLNSDQTVFDATKDIALIKTKLGTSYPCSAVTAWNSVADTDGTNVAWYSAVCTTGNASGNIFCADSQGFRGNVVAMPDPANGKCN